MSDFTGWVNEYANRFYFDNDDGTNKQMPPSAPGIESHRVVYQSVCAN